MVSLLTKIMVKGKIPLQVAWGRLPVGGPHSDHRHSAPPPLETGGRVAAAPPITWPRETAAAAPHELCPATPRATAAGGLGVLRRPREERGGRPGAARRPPRGGGRVRRRRSRPHSVYVSWLMWTLFYIPCRSGVLNGKGCVHVGLLCLFSCLFPWLKYPCELLRNKTIIKPTKTPF